MRYCAPPKERLALGLRRLRAVRGLSQIALAKRAGISRGYLARPEAGQQDPTHATRRLARPDRVAHDCIEQERAMITGKCKKPHATSTSDSMLRGIVSTRKRWTAGV